MTGKEYLQKKIAELGGRKTLHLDFSEIDDCKDLENLDDVVWPEGLTTIKYYDGRLPIRGTPPRLLDNTLARGHRSYLFVLSGRSQTARLRKGQSCISPSYKRKM